MEQSWALSRSESSIIVKEVFITPSVGGLDIRHYVPKSVVAPESQEDLAIPTKKGVSLPKNDQPVLND